MWFPFSLALKFNYARFGFIFQCLLHRAHVVGWIVLRMLPCIVEVGFFFQCTVCSVERGSGKEISFHLWEWAFNYLAGSALVGMAMACWLSGQTMRWKSSGPKTTKQRCRLVFPHRIQRPGISLQGCFWFLRISGAVAKPLSHGQEVFSVWDPLRKFSI